MEHGAIPFYFHHSSARRHQKAHQTQRERLFGEGRASYRISLDGGLSWQSTTQLGTATTIVIPDDTAGNLTGITVTLTSTQVITAGDLLAFGTTAPEFQYSDLQTALTNLRGTQLVWSFIGALSPMAATDAGSLDSLVSGWATGTRRTFAVVETRAKSIYETVSAWAGRILTEWENFTSTRVFPAAGGSQVTDPVTGCVFRGIVNTRFAAS